MPKEGAAKVKVMFVIRGGCMNIGPHEGQPRNKFGQNGVQWKMKKGAPC